MTDYHIQLKYLEDDIIRLDELYNEKKITHGEYIQIGLLLKILEQMRINK